MRLIVVIAFLLTLLSATNAQELARKGSLGVAFRQLDNQQGMLIETVFPGTTASEIQIETGDVIKSVNGKPVTQQSDFLHIISYWREGNDLTLTIERKGEIKELKGLVISKPKEKPAVGTIEYGRVKYRDGYLRSILNLPDNVLNPPCIFILPGFGCNSIDHYFSTTTPVRLIVEGLVDQGYAVYRMEKPGIGDSDNSDRCVEIGYHDEIEAFQSGLNTLKGIEQIDDENIILFGMSLGGATAVSIAAKSSVKGIVNFGSLFMPWYEALLKNLKSQPLLRGIPQNEIDANFKARQPILYEYFINKKDPVELAKNPEWDSLMRSGLPYWDGKYILNRDPAFMREINDISIRASLIKAACPVLAIHGEFDYNIVDSQWAKNTADVVNNILPGKGKFVILKGTEHGLCKVASMKENIRLRDTGGFTAEFRAANFNYKLIDTVAEWVDELTNGA